MSDEEAQIKKALSDLFLYCALVFGFFGATFAGYSQQNFGYFTALCFGLVISIALARDFLGLKRPNIQNYQILIFGILLLASPILYRYWVSRPANEKSADSEFFWILFAFLAIANSKLFIDTLLIFIPESAQLAIKSLASNSIGKCFALIKAVLRIAFAPFLFLGRLMIAPTVFLLSMIVVLVCVFLAISFVYNSYQFLESLSAAPNWAITIIALLAAILFVLLKNSEPK